MTNSAEPGSAATNALIDTAFDEDGIRTIDHQIAVLRGRILASSPRFGRLAPSYWKEIDQLLELRLWLTGSARA